MQILLNETPVVIPSTLDEMTLGQRIDYYNAHGRELDERLAELLEMEEGMERSMAEMEFTVDKAFRTVAFFAGVEPDALRESGQVDEVLAIYHTCLASLLEDEAALELELRHDWKGDTWVIAPPKLDPSSPMTFGEFVDSKVIVQNLAALGQSRWEALQNLAAIYFRKVVPVPAPPASLAPAVPGSAPGETVEPYSETFLYEGSERLALMRELPMSIALHVGFFLTSSVNIWLNTSRSSPNPQALPEPTPPGILSNGAG